MSEIDLPAIVAPREMPMHRNNNVNIAISSIPFCFASNELTLIEIDTQF